MALPALLVAGSSRASAQVTSNGFLVSHEVHIAAAPRNVYDALVGQVGAWWNPGHTFSGDARNLSIDARPGGCFCERLPDGGGLEHLRVVFVAPGEMVRMSGALGPLQASGVTGSLTWKLTPASGGTTVRLSYSVGGFIEGGFDKMAPAVEGVLGEQLRRLELFVETGKPTQGAGR
jgi:uncharacterized protein YndB with AHSA1/START domain